MASQEVLIALESLHHELEKLKPAITHVETAQQITEIVKVIPQKHIELLTEVKDNDAKHKGELKELFSKELTSLSFETQKLQNTTIEIQKQVKIEQEELAMLKNTVQVFHERVVKINFPERLDKLDANVAGIMAATQSVPSRVDSLDRNITDRLKDISERQKESFTIMQQNIYSATKKQNINTFITWGLIAIIAVILLIVK